MSSCEYCPSPARARGLCAKHWARWDRHGHPLATKRRPDNIEPQGVLTCYGCGRPTRDHKLTETCI